MESARPNRGAWSRQLWIAVATVTAIGLVGAVVDFLGLFAASGQGFAGGCGGFGGVLFILILLVLIVLGMMGALAAVGLFLFWRRLRWGPLLLVPSNLLVMGFFGWSSPVYPGQVVWAVVIVLLGAAPAIAVVLLVWPLLTRGRLWVRVTEFVVLGLIALPLVWLYVSGLTNDIRTGMTPPAAQVASTGCGSGSAWLPAVATTP
jgi:hypothetical protein